MFETVNQHKNWIIIKDNEGNLDKIIDIAQIRSINKILSPRYEGDGIDMKLVNKETTQIEFLNGDSIYVDIPITIFVESLGIEV